MRLSEDRFARISGLYLLHTARLKCAWCHRQGRSAEDIPFLVTPEELREAGYGVRGYSPRARRLIVRRAVAHYAAEHPEVTLPR